MRFLQDLRLRFLIAGAVLVGLVGCQNSTSNPLGISYSVESTKITETHYSIQVSGAAVVNAEGIRNVFHKEARKLAGDHDYKYRLSIESYTYSSSGGFMAGGIWIPQTYQHNGLRGSGYIFVLETNGGAAIDMDAVSTEAAVPAQPAPVIPPQASVAP